MRTGQTGLSNIIKSATTKPEVKVPKTHKSTSGQKQIASKVSPNQKKFEVETEESIIKNVKTGQSGSNINKSAPIKTEGRVSKTRKSTPDRKKNASKVSPNKAKLEVKTEETIIKDVSKSNKSGKNNSPERLTTEKFFEKLLTTNLNLKVTSNGKHVVGLDGSNEYGTDAKKFRDKLEKDLRFAKSKGGSEI